MSALRMVYLALAVAGAVLPVIPLVGWLWVQNFSVVAIADAWAANEAVSWIGWDLLISEVALTIWIISETRVRKNWIALLAIPAAFIIGVSCGLPLYLFLRTRPVT